MSRFLFLLASLSLLASIFLFPLPSQAAINIGITAHGSDNTALPGPPTNFTYTLSSNHQINLSWALGMSATTTIIRANWNIPPSTPTDGFSVYSSTDNHTIDWQDLSLTEDTLYYCAWSHNSIGYSTTYAQISINGGGINMAAVLFFGVITLFGLSLLALSWWTRISPLAFIAGIAWVAFGAYSFITGLTTDASLNTTLGVLSFLIGLIACFMPILWRNPLIQSEDSDYTSIGDERDSGGGQPFSQISDRDQRDNSDIAPPSKRRISRRQLHSEYRQITKRERRPPDDE